MEGEATSVRQAETEIDAAFAASPLVDTGYAQAVWTLLSVNEDYLLRALRDASGEYDMHIFADQHLNALTYPLRVCFNNGANKELRNALIDEHYRWAWEWIAAAEDYSQFSTMFPLWHRGRIELAVEGNRLIATARADPKHEYEAYNRLVRKEGLPDPEQPPMPDKLTAKFYAAIEIAGDAFRVVFNPELVEQLVAWLSPLFRARYTLPNNWAFSGFTLQEYRTIFSTIQAMLFAWQQARQAVAEGGVRGMGYRSAVWVVERGELLARLRRYTGVRRDVLECVLGMLTFGSSGVRAPDIATQPLIELRSGLYALAPFVWLNSAAERNLCALVNQIPEQRRIYADLTNQKEAATRDEIINALQPLGFSFASGAVTGTNLDLAIIDHNAKACLCLELKWFIEPAEIREVRDRTKELEDGVEQAKIISRLHAERDERLKRVLKIDGDYEFLPAVGSQNWIGFDDVQDPEVPIIKVKHLVSKIVECQSLPAVISWLRNRAYLPVEGRDYRVVPWEIASGKWGATWYGIEPLADTDMKNRVKA